MSMRDLVSSGADCSGDNAVASFAGSMLQDRYGAQRQDSWSSAGAAASDFVADFQAERAAHAQMGSQSSLYAGTGPQMMSGPRPGDGVPFDGARVARPVAPGLDDVEAFHQWQAAQQSAGPMVPYAHAGPIMHAHPHQHHQRPSQRAHMGNGVAWASEFDAALRTKGAAPPPPSMYAQQQHAGSPWAQEMLDQQRGAEWAHAYAAGMQGPRGAPHHHHRMQEAWMQAERDGRMHAAWRDAGPELAGQEWADDFDRERYAARDGFEGLEQYYAQEKAEADEWADEFATADQEDPEEAEWYAQYLAKEEQLAHKSLETITSSLTAIDDPKLQASNFMHFVRRLRDGELAFEGGSLVERSQEGGSAAAAAAASQSAVAGPSPWSMEFLGQQGGKQDAMTPPSMLAPNSEASLDHLYDEVWSDMGGDMLMSQVWGDSMGESGPTPYRFAQDNPYLGQPDAFERGIELYDQGRFMDAVLALEAAVQGEPTNGKAWHFLGRAHQEGDKDSQGIVALQNATQHDPTNLDALIDIAVSYTNNIFKDKALEALEEWLRRHPSYSRLAPSAPAVDAAAPMYGSVRSQARQAQVVAAFEAAAAETAMDPDPDVHIALGLLFNLSAEYDKAVQAFRTALTKRQDDYQLWNKLGATLANNNRSEEALEAYFNALEYKPLYVRARANLGISFMAMDMYQDAAKQFLGALDIEPTALHIWNNLETALSFMKRDDLVAKARERSVDVFRGDIDF